jgi:protein dithiol oxidoreductase (disulfide-forming)
MTRMLALAALLALAGCARGCAQSPAPAPPAPAASAAAQPEAPAAGAPAAGAMPAPSETEQATASQESGDAEGEHQPQSDASLERLAALPPSAQLPAGKWQPGVNYDPVVPAQPTSVSSGKVEVLEVFWLACPHCYALEPYLRSWLNTKPAYVQFVRVPVIWQPIHRAHARLYYTLDALGRQDLVQKAFDTLHHDLETRQPPLFGDSDPQTYQMQLQFAVQNGVSADEFAKAYNSFGVNANLQRAEEITQRYQVHDVPLIVVNGKYTTDLGAAGSETRLIELINDLAAAEHGH